MLIGIAIFEGKIESVHDPIVKYIPEITDKQLKHLTIQHCLSLASGIRADQGEIWPWNTKVKIYYSRDIRKLCYKIRYENEPGKVFHVEEMTPVLLGLVIERATGKTVSAYLEEKIWKQLGMEENALWVTDSRRNGFEAINSGLTATPMDLARIGSLYLKHGRWDGKSIISEEWIRSSTAPDTTSVSFWHNIQAYGNCDVYFNDMWWGLRNKDGNYEYSANGHFGQRIYMVPEKNLLILRFGSSAGHTDWTAFIHALSDKL